jgi:hypothetical protein
MTHVYQSQDMSFSHLNRGETMAIHHRYTPMGECLPDVSTHWRNTSTSSIFSFKYYSWAIHHRSNYYDQSRKNIYPMLKHQHSLFAREVFTLTSFAGNFSIPRLNELAMLMYPSTSCSILEPCGNHPSSASCKGSSHPLDKYHLGIWSGTPWPN